MSSETTVVVGTGVKVAASASIPFRLIELICSPVSEEPAASMTMMCGSSSISRARTAGDSGAAPLLTAASPDRSYSRASSSAISGRTIASPTTGRLTQPSRTTVSSTERGSKLLGSAGSTIFPPLVIMWNVDHCAAPCMNGSAMSRVIPPAALRAFSAIAS